MNDDMYVCPEWDKYLMDEIDALADDYFFLSCTLIEPNETGNRCVIHKDYGSDCSNFKEEQLLNEHESLLKEDWNGATWPPNIIHKNLWNMVGGYSVEFSPGMYSDPDFSMKLWQLGVRLFKGLGRSHVYHFQCKSTRKIKKNNGNKQFKRKWGVSPSIFLSLFLRLSEPFQGLLKQPLESFKLKLSRFKSRF
jgi:hypothetical protein